MKRVESAIFCVLMLLTATARASEPRAASVEDVLSLESVTDPRISPDGRWVAYVVTKMDFEESSNDSAIWAVALGEVPAEPVRLTSHDGVNDTPRWSSDSSWLMFASDRSGSRQVHGIRPDGGEAWQVTQWHTSVESFRLSPDGDRLGFVAKPTTSDAVEAFESSRGRPVVWDETYADEWSYLWVSPVSERRAASPEQVSPEELFVSAFEFSPDSSLVAFSARPRPALRSRSEMDVFVVSADGGDARKITQMPGGETAVAWTPSGVIVAATGQRLGTFNRKLWEVSPDTSAVRPLTDALDENATFVSATPAGLYVEAAERTGRGLFRVGTRATRVSTSPYASSFSMSEDGSLVAFLEESGSRPANVFVSRTDAFEPSQLSRHNSHVETSLALGEQRVVTWKSRADGESIEGILNLPVGYREGTRVPLLLVIHGGPSGVSSDRFSARRGAYPVQVFAGMGYAVLQPNYRGSTGYGERFRGLNRGDISGRDWVDIDSGVDALIEQGIADSARLGIMGWSFGGHHTFWGITQTTRYRAASAGAGANDLISMYSQTDLPEFYHTYLGPKPWEDFELYEERSAYRNVTRVTTPLLIQVGERDERVPAEQSIQFYEAVRAIGKAPTKLVVYPGQPHGVREPRLVRDLLIRNVEWFEKWVPVSAMISTNRPGPNAR